MNLYPAALKRIKRLERGLVKALARELRGLAGLLTDPHSRAVLVLHFPALREKLKAVILHYVAQAYADGVSVARTRLRKDGAAHFAEQLALDLADLVEIPLEWARWYEATLDVALANYTDRIRRDLGRLTTQAASDGKTNAELTADIERLCDGLRTWQAERIARTEVMRLWNLGHYGELGQSEDLVGYAYSVVLDDRTSHICQPLEGVKVRRDEVQFVPPLHCHCRTILEPVYGFDDVAEADWQPGSTPRPSRGFGQVPALIRGA